MKNPPWTSIDAYSEIYQTLPSRRKEVLQYLCRYVMEFHENPTAQELVRYTLKENYRWAHDVWKRLSELADEYHAVTRGAARPDRTSEMTSFTWIPGPPPGEKIHKRIKHQALPSRIALQILQLIFDVLPSAMACADPLQAVMLSVLEIKLLRQDNENLRKSLKDLQKGGT